MYTIPDETIGHLKERRMDFEKAAESQMAVWEGKNPGVQPLLLSCTLDHEFFMILYYKLNHHARSFSFCVGVHACA